MGLRRSPTRQVFGHPPSPVVGEKHDGSEAGEHQDGDHFIRICEGPKPDQQSEEQDDHKISSRGGRERGFEAFVGRKEGDREYDDPQHEERSSRMAYTSDGRQEGNDGERQRTCAENQQANDQTRDRDLVV